MEAVFKKTCLSSESIYNITLPLDGTQASSFLKPLRGILQNYMSQKTMFCNVFFLYLFSEFSKNMLELQTSSLPITSSNCKIVNVQKRKFFIKDMFCKCNQIRRKLRIWSYLLKKSLMKNFILCAVCQHCLHVQTRVR